MVDFCRTISITNGLPYLRTSVDYGTAFDIAGKNIAESISMEECIKIAAENAPKFTAKTKVEKNILGGMIDESWVYWLGHHGSSHGAEFA
jgi:hypothetical protein